MGRRRQWPRIWLLMKANPQGALELAPLFRAVPHYGQGAAHAFDSCTIQSFAAGSPLIIPSGREQFPVGAIAVTQPLIFLAVGGQMHRKESTTVSISRDASWRENSPLPWFPRDQGPPCRWSRMTWSHSLTFLLHLTM